MTVGPSTSVAEDRHRQIAAAAWILGWIGGPLPALMILLVARPGGWVRRLVMAAAAFWAAMWAAFVAVIYVAASSDVPMLWLWWTIVVLVAFAGTIAGTTAAVRHSRASAHRAPW